jgi:hypothetical protein
VGYGRGLLVLWGIKGVSGKICFFFYYNRKMYWEGGSIKGFWEVFINI